MYCGIFWCINIILYYFISFIIISYYDKLDAGDSSIIGIVCATLTIVNEPPHDITNKVACAPRVFAVHLMGS